jgi:hypothetical protein
MTATTAFLCIMTVSLVGIPISTRSQITAVSGSDGGSVPSGGQETGKPATPRKADPNVTARGTPSAGQQIPVPADRKQAVEERLRSGQMEKAIAQSEISERLNQLYRGPNSSTGETAAEHSSR